MGLTWTVGLCNLHVAHTSVPLSYAHPERMTKTSSTAPKHSVREIMVGDRKACAHKMHSMGWSQFLQFTHMVWFIVS